jgi:hypothetical protein
MAEWNYGIGFVVYIDFMRHTIFHLRVYTLRKACKAPIVMVYKPSNGNVAQKNNGLSPRCLQLASYLLAADVGIVFNLIFVEYRNSGRSEVILFNNFLGVVLLQNVALAWVYARFWQ